MSTNLSLGFPEFSGELAVTPRQSLEAVALLSMVREVFGVKIEPLALFDEVTTVALMAELIQRQ